MSYGQTQLKPHTSLPTLQSPYSSSPSLCSQATSLQSLLIPVHSTLSFNSSASTHSSTTQSASDPSPSSMSHISPPPLVSLCHPSPSPFVQPSPPPAVSSTSADLPPCKVCGDKGSGFHYGVNTCNSCKGFFQRAMNRQSWAVCKKREQCRATKTRKRMCATCRYERCVESGMSKSAIKLGRYTSEKKTLCTEEVQQLRVQAKICGDRKHLLSEEARVDELNQLISNITISHINHGAPKDFYTNLLKREREYQEYLRYKEEMFGSMKPLTMEEYDEIYKETGLDVDGRLQLIQEYMPSFEVLIQQFIKFIKILPGFKLLPLSDQIRLLKGSGWYEHDTLRYYHTYNRDAELFCDPFNPKLVYTLRDMSLFYPPEAIEAYKKCITRLQDLDLTPEEQAMLQSFALVYTDAELSPEGHRILLSMQEVISDALYQLLRRNHDHPDRFLAKLISTLRTVKECCEEFCERDVDIFQRYDELPIIMPEAVREVLGV